MNRLFHAKIRMQSWLLLLVVLFVTLYAGWHRQGPVLLLGFLLLVLLVERMIHTSYMVTDRVLEIHNGRFSKTRVIPLDRLIRIERVSGLRFFGKSPDSFLMITYGGADGERHEVAVIPQHEEEFVRFVEKMRGKPD